MMKNLLNKIKPFVTSNKGISNGALLFKNTRIPVIHILKQFTLGWDINEIKQRYPDVNKKYVLKVLSIITSEFKLKNGKQKEDQIWLPGSGRQSTSSI
ncbi:MAG: DUF433 domain-containing protein [Thermodesulfovibrionales bacterium]